MGVPAYTAGRISLMSRKVTVVLAALACSAAAFGQVVFNGQPSQLTPPPAVSRPEDRCIVSGRVTNALTGEPVRKATLRLTRNNVVSAVSVPGPPQGYSATSAADGSFRFENVEPGTYNLAGDRNGFLPTQYGARSYGQRGSAITLSAAQQMTDFIFALTPQAVISGKVVDQDGDPVPNAMVQLVGQSWQHGKLRYTMRNGNSTNDLGEYRIANVTPGKYYLVVQSNRFQQNNVGDVQAGKPDMRAVKTYYPESASPQGATQLDVKAGQDLIGMDVRQRFAATYHVRGKIAGTIPDDRIGVNVSASPRDEQEMGFGFGGGSNVSKDHTFDLAGMPPGSYTLNLYSFGHDGPRTLGHVDIDIGEGDLNDIQIAVIPPGTVHGQVMIEGNPPPGKKPADTKSVRVFLNPSEPFRLSFGNQPAEIKDDGSFVIENVSPGKYDLHANPPSGIYLKSVRMGNQEYLGKALDLNSGSGQLTVVFSYGVAEVDGSVQFPDSGTSASSTAANGQPAPAPEANIVLVPYVLNEDGSGFRFGTTSSGGSFTLKGVSPGRYRAYAFEQSDYGAMQSPDVLRQLEPLGVELELKENDKIQIQLHLVTEEQMQQIYARLGIEPPQD